MLRSNLLLIAMWLGFVPHNELHNGFRFADHPCAEANQRQDACDISQIHVTSFFALTVIAASLFSTRARISPCARR